METGCSTWQEPKATFPLDSKAYVKSLSIDHDLSAHECH